MMKIRLICVGKLKEEYLKRALCEYTKRIGAYADFKSIEIKEAHLGSEPSKSELAAAMQKEGNDILKAAGNSKIIAMCIEGEQMSSTQFSAYMSRQANNAQSNLSFVVGGSWGLSDRVRENAALCLSFGKMTFPHQLFRVILAEQIYRAFNIMNNGKYHK